MPKQHIADTVNHALVVAKNAEVFLDTRLNEVREDAQKLERELAEKRAEIEAYEEFLRGAVA